MIRVERLSIRAKLVGIILLITTLSLAGGFTFVIVNDVRTFKRDMVESTVLMAQVIGDHSVSVLAFRDQAGASEILAKLDDVPTIERAWVYDAEGKVFSSFGRTAGDAPAPPMGASNAFRGGALHVFQPIVYKNERYGTIYISASTRLLDQKIRRHLAVMLSALASLIGLSVLFAVRLQKIISEPVLRLAAAARWISEAHDYSVRVEKTAEDEIGVLCDGFNDMLSQIQRRERERDLADRRTREKSQFLANMSHELRTPLNSIIGFSEILIQRLEGKLSPREEKFLQNINASGKHLLGIVNDILDLSKVEAGRMEILPETFSVRSAVESVCSLMRGVSSKRDVTFDVDLPEGLPPIEADPAKFKQVLYNLLANAVKFSPEGSAVLLRARLLAADVSPIGEASIELAVSDRGPGIDPKEHATVFEEFRQAEGTAARGVEGTGLGLALVRKFVELHRGTVRLESAPGRGTTFTVTFPVRFSPEGDEAVTEAAGDGHPRVLVIESDGSAYEAIRRDLVAASYSPAWARDAEEALRLTRSLQPAAITLDLSLPRMEAWDFLKRLKADRQTRGIPVVIVSVLDNRELGLTLGADDYFLKPLDFEGLLRRVKGLAPPDGPRGARILVIDDDPQVHELLRERLGASGYELEHALSGREGLARAEAHPPALVVLDLMMEGMDGFELAVRLKASPRTAAVPVLVLTARDLTEEDRGRLQGRIDALVRKGEATGSQLVSVIGDLLSRVERSRASA